jgi:Fur family zinc uptake transcriptional regulator
MLALSQEFNQAGFMVHSKAIEVHGICAKCQKLSGDQN